MQQFQYIHNKNIARLPKSPGVYAFKADEGILYIGKAINIKERVKSHFKQPTYRDDLFLGQTTKIGYIITNSEIEALILEANLIKKYRPKYNIVWKDDKNYFYVAITKEKFPRIFITHQPDKSESQKSKSETNKKFKILNSKRISNFALRASDLNYIGPFVEGASLKKVLTFLRKVFPYYTLRPGSGQALRLRSGQAAKKHPKGSCLWCDLKLCPGPNPDKKDYQKNINNLIAVLEGKSKWVLRELKKEMRRYSESQDYEKAGKIKEKIFALEKVISHSRPSFCVAKTKVKMRTQSSSPVLEPSITDQNQLPIKWNFRKVEAYDVSNIQGKDATASMVTFISGKPEKNFYRKFKIRTVDKPNDTAMIKEALGRRLKHLEWPMPDLFLIDGGKAQLNAAKQVKNANKKSKNIPVMALAKRKNELYVENLEKPILLEKMPREIFNLIMRLRDEAHRFAISYHRKLREKRIL